MKIMKIIECHAIIIKDIESPLKIMKQMKILESYENIENHETLQKLKAIIKKKNDSRRILCENKQKT